MAQLDRARRRVEAGDLPEVEVIRAEDGVASRLEDIIVNENLVLTRQRELKRLVNVEGLEQRTEIMLIPMSEPDPIRYGVDPDAYVEAAIANRMELLELELQLTIDESTIAFERNQALPLFTLDYTYRLNGLGTSANDAFGVTRDGEFSDWLLGLRAEIPIGNQGAKSRVRRAILQRLQRLASKESREQSIEQEVLDAIDTIDSGWQRILAARLSSIAAGRTLEAEQRQFDVGRRTSTDVLDAATRLAQAQSSEIAALTDYEIAQIDLAFATGTILGKTRVDWAPTDLSGTDPGGPVIDPDSLATK
jgi:outer membrane protein TolC